MGSRRLKSCGVCKAGKLVPCVENYSTEMSHDGQVYELHLESLDILKCDNCQSILLPDESYEKVVSALRRKANLFTPAFISENRIRLGLNQKEMAQLLNVAKETVSRWENGGQIQQRAMNVFLKVFFKVPSARKFLYDEQGIPVKPEDTALAFACHLEEEENWRNYIVIQNEEAHISFDTSIAHLEVDPHSTSFATWSATTVSPSNPRLNLIPQTPKFTPGW